MNVAGLIFRIWCWISGKIFGIWVRPAVQPNNPVELLSGTDAKVCYVLETGDFADTLALERVCRICRMPSPAENLNFAGIRENRRIIIIRRKRISGSMRLKRLIEASMNADGKELLLVPVAIYWGRSPDRERSLIKLFFSENWDEADRTRKFFATLLHGRNTLLRFSEPVTLSSMFQEDSQPEQAYRKASRILRVHFRQRRTATVGSNLPHRQTLINQVLMNPRVRHIIKAESGDNRALLERKSYKARKYAQEIAAHISYPTIRVVARFLGWLWNRIYDGIALNNLERLHEVARDKEVIYVPCHRSHVDYLLLAYIFHDQGLSIPHTAAGINLNIPIVGAILRRGGAFFVRRSFKENRLYAAVFNAYLCEILKRGYTIEYFVEGARSRTGRLLAPKAGMLAMTVHSYLQNPRRPIVFMPIYFGYEKLIEGDSFIRELSGAEKQKESLVGLIRSVKSLRKNFGKVYVNVGKPVTIESILDEIKPDWCETMEKGEERPDEISEIIDELGARIMSGINSAAAVTPISLLSTVLLSTPKQSIRELELIQQLRMSLKLLEKFEYSDSVTLPGWSPEQIILHGLKLGVIDRTAHQLGDILHMPKYEAVRMTYFRNNVQHLFAIPGLIACCFIQECHLKHIELQRLVGLIYPFMKETLCLKWDPEDIDDVITSGIEALLYLQILTRSKDGKVLVKPPTDSRRTYQLLMLGQSMAPMLQCFFLVISLLVKNGSGVLSCTNLERLCQQSAELLPMIYGLHSPDLFDKVLFQDFIRALFAQKILRCHNNDLLEFDEDITSIEEDIQLILGEKICHSILSLIFSDKKADLGS